MSLIGNLAIAKHTPKAFGCCHFTFSIFSSRASKQSKHSKIFSTDSKTVPQNVQVQVYGI
tara:strand:+ start:291 stop:470 length:180 start_codon:yes stop_codon:yes gene_type:complete